MTPLLESDTAPQSEKPPTLTVAIPVYNGEKYLRRCLDSVVAQTYSDLEVLLLDDGSTDGAPKILEEYRARYPDRFVINTHRNLGIANNRNLAIDIARGRYIMFIDADDFVRPDYCEVFVKAIEQLGYDDVRGGFVRVDDDGRLFDQTAPHDSEWARYILITPWAKIHRTEFLREKGIRFADSYGEDIIFCLKSASCTEKIAVIQYTGYFWYYNKASVSNTLYLGFDPKVNVIKMFEQIAANGGGKDEYSEYFLVRSCIYYLLYSGRYGTPQDFMMVHETLFGWMQSHFPGSMRNRFLLWGPRGESLRVNLIILAFMIIRRLHLLGLFSRVYCIGGRRQPS